MTLSRSNRALKLESLRLGFTFSKPSLRDSSLTHSGPRGIYVELESQKLEFLVDATWTPLPFKLESLRLGLLKVKPSLKGSSFKALYFWQ